MKAFLGHNSKRAAAVLGAALLASSLGMGAAQAGPTPVGTKTYYDKVGETAPRADIRKTTVVATDAAVWVNTRITNLRGVGRYRAYVNEFPYDARGSRLRVVVTKELGKAPVASMLWWNYGDGVWAKVPCSMAVAWDVDRDVVRVQLPRRCSYIIQGDAFSVSAADFSANDASDRITLDTRTW